MIHSSPSILPSIEKKLKKRAVWIFNEVFKIPTLLSVASFKAHMDIPISLVYIGDPDLETIKVFEGLGNSIEIIPKQLLQYSKEYLENAHIGNRLVRMEVMRKWPKEQVLLLDSDLIFSEKIKQLIPYIDAHFESIKANDSVVWGVSEADRSRRFFTLKIDASGNRIPVSPIETHQCIRDVYGPDWEKRLSGVQYNNGMLLMYNCKALADAWETNYLNGLLHPVVNLQDDQLPLFVAMYDLKTKVLEMDPTFNSLGNLSGDYAVYHAWASTWKKELQKIVQNQPSLEDYGQIAKQYFDKIPQHWINALDFS